MADTADDRRIKNDIANKRDLSDALEKRRTETGDESYSTEADRQNNERQGLKRELDSRSKTPSDDDDDDDKQSA